MSILPDGRWLVNQSVDTALSLDRPGIVAARLRGIADRSGDAELAALARETEAIEDRLTYAEAALHHLRDDLDKLIAVAAIGGAA